MSTNTKFLSIEKQAFHSSLLKSIDFTEKMTQDEFLESHRDHNLNKENIKAASSGKILPNKSKIHQITNYNLKSPITTPRQQNESFKNNMTSSKLLNTRKSHDISYLTKSKQKVSNDMITTGLINSATLSNGSKNSNYKGKQLEIRGIN